MDPSNWLYDKRVLRRNLDKGVLVVAEFNKHLGKLPDLADDCEIIDLNDNDEDGEEETDEPQGEE